MTAHYDIDEMPARCIADSRAWFPAIHDREVLCGWIGIDMGALVHFALGIAGEVGELVNLIKKMNRAHLAGSDLRDFDWGALPDECTDVLIYLMDIMAVLDITPSTAYEFKRKKLIDRWGEP